MATYSNDHTRLMAHFTNPELVFGYVVEDWETLTETLYAVSRDGKILARTDKLHGDSFNGKNWAEVENVPARAEYIGTYKLKGAA